MKRRRTMLLAVTATSMAASLACTPEGQPVGKVGRPDYVPEPEIEAGADAESDAAVPLPSDVTATPDAGTSAKPDAGAAKIADAGAAVKDAGAKPKDAGTLAVGQTPDFHPDRVGTTANVDDVSPTVGTTARVPDKKK